MFHLSEDLYGGQLKDRIWTKNVFNVSFQRFFNCTSHIDHMSYFCKSKKKKMSGKVETRGYSFPQFYLLS